MRAVILAGGRGTRLAPYTTVIPKPLLPVGDMPILEIVIRQLCAAGFTRITLTLGYMSEYFRVFLAHHRSLARLVDIDVVEEEEPTGTAGSLSRLKGVTGTFLVMNGDLLTTLDYRDLLAHHRRRDSFLTIAAQHRRIPIDLGVLEVEPDGSVIEYREKPELTHLVSMGIYVYEPGVLDWIRDGEYLDFPNLVQTLVGAGKTVDTYQTAAEWLDLGRPEDLCRATDIFRERRAEFLPGPVV